MKAVAVIHVEVHAVSGITHFELRVIAPEGAATLFTLKTASISLESPGRKMPTSPGVPVRLVMT